MQVVIYRGTHQIGGVATEIRAGATRILIDMGDELSLADNFTPTSLSITGVTDDKGNCNGVLFTHNHGDHIGQVKNIRNGIPLYMGNFAKDVSLASLSHSQEDVRTRIVRANTFEPGERFQIGSMVVTPFSVDHSACDSYMFLIEADGKRVLHTGDFRLHGFRGKAIPKILDKLAGRINALIIEGTTLSRAGEQPMTERELQQKVREYMAQYQYVFVLCASTNLERVCAMSKAVPRGKYFICDEYQGKLLDLLEQHWGGYSPLYRNIKKTIYGENLITQFQACGFLMMIRDNKMFRDIIPKFDPEQSILLYSMWDGYRTKPNSTIPELLKLTGCWESLHTSGHASQQDLQTVIKQVRPEFVIPIHTDRPERLKEICPDEKIIILRDGDEFTI